MQHADDQAGSIDAAREARLRMARLLAEQHRLHLAMAQECRMLKRFTTDGQSLVEIEIATDMLEQYLSASDAFLENCRGRLEGRLGLLRRGDPQGGPQEDMAPRHGAFWLTFSRLCAALRRVERRIGA